MGVVEKDTAEEIIQEKSLQKVLHKTCEFLTRLVFANYLIYDVYKSLFGAFYVT